MHLPWLVADDVTLDAGGWVETGAFDDVLGSGGIGKLCGRVGVFCGAGVDT